jgi:hypothetical protein
MTSATTQAGRDAKLSAKAERVLLIWTHYERENGPALRAGYRVLDRRDLGGSGGACAALVRRGLLRERMTLPGSRAWGTEYGLTDKGREVGEAISSELAKMIEEANR